MSKEKTVYDIMQSASSPYPELPQAPPGYEESVRPSAPSGGPFKDNNREMKTYLEPAPALAVSAPGNFVPFQLGQGQASVVCPRCNASVLTEVSTSSKCLAHCSCFLLMIFGCFLCCCIPYCMDSCKKTTHKCPNCKAILGTAV